MLANYHTHTKRCNHAWGEDREYVECAIQGGMKVLGFSDHCPWIYHDGFTSHTRMTPNQLDDYFTSLTDLKKEYADDIKLYIGFEAEYIPEQMEDQDAMLKDYPVDYMIMGQHFLGREPYATYTGFETTEEAVLQQYVELVIEGMETGRYVYVAHPDLLHYVGPDEIYAKHFTRLCQYLKEKHVPVEINMLGFLEKRHYPSDRFLQVVRQVGNTVIIGCDAHTPDRLAMVDAQERCRQMAERYGLTVVDFLPRLQ